MLNFLFKSPDPNDLVLYFDYPYASKVNPILHQLIVEQSNVEVVQGGGVRTSTDLHHKGIKEIDNLVVWIKNLIPDCSRKFVNWNGTGSYYGTGGRGGYDPYKLKIDTLWGMLYPKGEGCVEHNHFPYPMGFVYYVNTPAGCSPTLFAGKKIRPKEGQLIMFMGHHYHGVPTSNVKGRSVMAGLITYEPN